MKKVAIIGTVGIPAKYGGFETLAEQLVSSLYQDFDFTVYCSRQSYKDRGVYPLARRVFIPFNANGISSIIYDLFSILHALWYADCIVLLGVSAGFMIPVIRLFTRIKIVTNIDGLEWKREKWKGFAKAYLKSQENIAVNHSHVVISDNKAIQQYVSKEYQRLTNYIAYGGSHVHRYTEIDHEKVYAFSVCRIEPENNVHIILEAFSETTFPLIFVGNWQASDYGKSLFNNYSTVSHFTLLDPIYDQEQLDALRNHCTVYIHGHSAGGTNPSLVEAMYLGLPTICWDVSYNKETTQGKALYFDSVTALQALLQTPKEQLKEIGNKLQSYAEEVYQWDTIAQQYKQVILGESAAIASFTNVPLTVSIVLYKNDKTILQHTIESVLQTPIEKKVFLIDNSPTNALENYFIHPDICYIYVGKNLGFGTAHNLILDTIEQRSTYHLVLNPDVYFSENVIPTLLETLQRQDDVAAIAPKTRYPNGDFQFSCRRYPTFFEMLWRRLQIFKSVIQKGEYRDIDLNKSFYPDFILGAFLLFKTKDFVALKGFDNRFFMYMEDVDICKRIDALGKRKYYYPKVEIYHHSSKGSAKNLKLFFHHTLSAIQYFYKWSHKS